MKVTREMLDVAMKKAVEAGLLPRHACDDDAATHEELIRHVLQAAFELQATEQPLLGSQEPLQRSSGRREDDFHDGGKRDRVRTSPPRGMRT